MGGVVGNGSSGIGRNNFASCSYVEGWRRVREACSWQGCMFPASKASHVNDHFRLLKNLSPYYCEGEHGMYFVFGTVLWDMFFWDIGGHGAGESSINRYSI